MSASCRTERASAVPLTKRGVTWETSFSPITTGIGTRRAARNAAMAAHARRSQSTVWPQASGAPPASRDESGNAIGVITLVSTASFTRNKDWRMISQICRCRA